MPFGLLENPAEGVQELLATDALLGDLRGSEPLYRPFGRAKIGPHLLNAPTWAALVERRYTVVLWTHVAPERPEPETWFNTSFEHCKSRPWSVVVMHDIPTGGTKHLGDFLRFARGSWRRAVARLSGCLHAAAQGRAAWDAAGSDAGRRRELRPRQSQAGTTRAVGTSNGRSRPENRGRLQPSNRPPFPCASPISAPFT